MKKLLIILASLIVILFLALMIVPKLINWNRFIASKVKDATGRDLLIDGAVSLSIFPNLMFSASGVHLSNAPGAKHPEMVTIGAISGKLKVLPLLGRRVVIESFVIDDLSVNLEVDKAGLANWDFGAGSPSAPEPQKDRSGADAGLPIKDLSLGDVRLSQGKFTFADATTGQILNGKDVNLNVALANLSSPLKLGLQLILNNEPVKVEVSVNAPRGVLEGPSAAINASVVSKFVTTGYQGGIQRKPVTGLDGTFDLNAPSVGRLAAWLGQPLDASQPDPGPLKVHATFEGKGAKVALTQATIEGSALKAKATGSYDGSGAIAKVALNVESETLDIDRYLPPAATDKKPPKSAPAKPKQAAPGDIMAAFSEKPLDLSPLRKTEANVRIAIRGIKAMGFAIGQIDFTTTLKDSLLTANLNELRLYGGNVNGTFKLDGSGDALGVDAKLKVERVQVDKLASAATGGPSPITGIASGNLRATARGASPRRLVESMQGGIDFDLGGVDIQNAPGGAISELKVALDLPGIERSPTLKSSVVYNKQRVSLDLTTDPLKKVLSDDRFVLKASVDSKLIRGGYDGKVQQRPVAGLDGTLNLDVPSVGGLASWLGQPLDASQPDPGPLKLVAAFASTGSRSELKEATITGKALQAKATGSYDGSGAVPALRANLRVEKANLNAYLPPPVEPDKAAPKPAPKEKPVTQEPSGWSEEPLDLAPLSRANADIKIDIDSLSYRDLTIQPGRITIALKNGVLRAATEEFHVSDGTIASTVNLDGSGKAARLDYQVGISGLEARPLLKTLADNDRLSGKTEFQAKGSAKGQNQKELVGSLTGNGQFKFLDGAIHGINIPATLRQVRALGLNKEAVKTAKTDFAELSGSFVIKDGILENRDLKMLAPLMRLSGEGRVPMPQRSVDYNVTVKLVASLKGQGGKDSLAGVPIPISIQGGWDNISYKVDWKKVFSDISADPERLKNLPQDLRDAGKNFGIDLPLPKLLDTGKGTSPLEQLLPIQKKPVETPAEATPPKAPEEKPKVQPLDPSKVLKDLFKK